MTNLIYWGLRGAVSQFHSLFIKINQILCLCNTKKQRQQKSYVWKVVNRKHLPLCFSNIWRGWKWQVSESRRLTFHRFAIADYLRIMETKLTAHQLVLVSLMSNWRPVLKACQARFEFSLQCVHRYAADTHIWQHHITAVFTWLSRAPGKEGLRASGCPWKYNICLQNGNSMTLEDGIISATQRW